MNRTRSYVAIAFSCSFTALITFAAGVYATEEAKLASPKAQPLVLSTNEALITRLRGLSETQQRVVEGDTSALSGQLTLARSLAQELGHKSAAAWHERRDLHALVKYVLSGGDPTALGQLAKSATLKDGDAALVNGVVAYSRGDRDRALSELSSVNHRLLRPSLAGHVALVKAVIASKSSGKDALQLCREAILLSPGTHIEEASLRLMISIASSAGDAIGVERAHTRHLLRFPNSLYARDIDARVSRIVAGNPEASAAMLREMDDLPKLIPAARRRAFFAQLAEAGLRAGNPSMAIRSARMALLPPDSPPQSTAETTATLRAIEGAALVLTDDREEGIRRLSDAQQAGPDPDAAALIAAARGLVAMIDAPPASTRRTVPVAKAMSFALASPPQKPSALPSTTETKPPYEFVISRGAAALANVDRLLEHAGK